MRALIVTAYVLCCVLWGSTWMVVKIGLEDLPPLRFAAIRMMLAFALLTPLAVRAGLGSLREGGAWRTLLLTGVANMGLSFALLFVGQQWISSGLAAVIFATFPIWMTLIGRLLLPQQALTLPRMLAGPIGLTGVALIQLPHLGGVSMDRAVALGGLFVITASILMASCNVLMRRDVPATHPVVVAWSQIGVGGVVIGLLAILLERGMPAAWTPRAVSSLVYLAVFGTVTTYLLWYWLLPRLPLAAMGVAPLLDTLFAVILGAVILEEEVGWRFAVAAALILTAAGLANLSPEGPPAPAAEPEATPAVNPEPR